VTRAPVLAHIDATGAPCAHHAPAGAEALMQLALVGSRAPAFHHDCASKLQGLLMALDEIGELTEHGDPQVLRALAGAVEASRELNALLNTNRALTKGQGKADVTLKDLVSRASQRVGLAVQGTLPDVTVGVMVPAMTHALALVLDAAAGAGRGRSLAITATLGAGDVELVLPAASPSPASASEGLALATFVITRDGGRLWCAPDGTSLHVQLPAVA